MKIIYFLFLVSLLTAQVATQSSKCYDELMEKAQNGQICQKGDTDCIAALAYMSRCVKSCSINLHQQSQIINCVQKECVTANQTVQKYINDVIKCANSSLILVNLILALFFIMI
ncbi:hypothetical protein ABPG74_004848 [Tetrahymena malaccensis]